MFSNAKWFWPSVAADGVNQYVQFRHVFELVGVAEASQLIISCEGNFAAYINGEFVATGQFGDYPDKPTYSQVDVTKFLRSGKNVLAIVGYHFGIEHFSHIKGDASLMYCLLCGQETISGGTDTQYRIGGGYRIGEIERLTSQMGFVFEYDARKNDDWMGVDYVCGDTWKHIAEGDVVIRPEPVVRPLPMLDLKSQASMQIVDQGTFKRESTDGKTFGEMMQSDKLWQASFEDVFAGSNPIEIRPDVLKESGVYLIVDLGREECGFISLDLEGPAGTVIDISVGQHLCGKRVRASVGGRNFASRYICGEGSRRFTHFNNRYSGRFVELHISPATGPVKINYAGIIPAEYPIKMAGKFKTPDTLMNEIYEVSRRTLHLCMHEHYEDTPWREQALYANDSRNQALTGYYSFGEYEFPQVSFDLLGRSVRADNYLTLTAPSRAVDFTIPSFTMAWFVAMDDLLLFSGNTGFIKSYLPQIQKMLDDFIESTIDGLLPCPKGKEYWHFYDWADGLDGTGDNCCNWKLIDTIRFDAPLNLFFVMALQSAARIFKTFGGDEPAEKYGTQANVTKSAVNKKFWVESKQAYQTYSGRQGIDNHFCELVQSLAILTGAADERRAGLMRQKLTDEYNNMVATTLSQSLYKYEALCGDLENYAPWIFEDIRKKWGYMLEKGATSFWETIKGDADFDNAGSLCHGWSAIPAYFYQAYLLGVKPLENGFKKFSVAPVTNIIDQAEGAVITPLGAIKIAWEKVGTKIQVNIEHPAGTEAIVNSEFPLETKITVT